MHVSHDPTDARLRELMRRRATILEQLRELDARIAACARPAGPAPRGTGPPPPWPRRVNSMLG